MAFLANGKLTTQELLTTAKFTPPSTIKLKFADGRHASLAIKLLDMPIDRFDWSTAAASATGEHMTVKGIKGEIIPIDTTVLRYFVDKKYAAMMDAKLKSLQFTEEELEQLVQNNRPPAEWFAQPSRDLTLESWK